MLCVFPVFQKDVCACRDLLLWIKQLGGCHYHNALIVADAGTRALDVFALKTEASISFRNTEIISTEMSVSGWIAGANALFLEAARAANAQLQPWLFLEPDAVPTCKEWLDKIEIQYRARGAKYMGAFVPCKDPGLPQLHMPGVSVYPPEAYSQLSNIIRGNPDRAFDMAIAEITVANGTKSDLFQHLWGEFNNPPTFSYVGKPGTNLFGLDYIKPQTAIFHRNKDGTLIELLRLELGIRKKNFIQLGRTGDIMLALPALKWIYDRDGVRPRFIISDEMAQVLDGVSYVEQIPVRLHWWFGLHDALKFAKKNFGDAVVLQCHGDKWPVDTTQPTFMHASHFRTGVPMDLFMKLPMVFDKRCPEREAQFIPKTNGKPYIMINTSGFSSPFPYERQLYGSLNHLRKRIEIINMGGLRLPRIYDLLGLYDRAIGTIHIDTSTLHLAHASPTPYIGFSRGGWSSSTPRGNCVLNMEYAQYPARINDVVRTVESWIP